MYEPFKAYADMSDRPWLRHMHGHKRGETTYDLIGGPR